MKHHDAKCTICNTVFGPGAILYLVIGNRNAPLPLRNKTMLMCSTCFPIHRMEALLLDASIYHVVEDQESTNA